MLNYWDSSALVTLFVDQDNSEFYLAKLKESSEIVTSWHAVPECASAFCRLRREGLIREEDLTHILDRLRNQSANWYVVGSGKRLEHLTLRVLRVHPLRAMDAIHLAAACLVRGDDMSTMRFLSSDQRLNDAAAKEGFIL
jgi:predicted nucleic acid-binding protein